jgi:hypothetical protein
MSGTIGRRSKQGKHQIYRAIVEGVIGHWRLELHEYGLDPLEACQPGVWHGYA